MKSAARLSALDALTEALRRLPGVGPKSAQRIAYHLLQHDRDGAARLGLALTDAVEKIHHCALCNTFTENELCATCASPKRDRSLLCVVETPADQLMIEQTLTYGGLYFVLMGHLSPLDGIGPKDIHLERLAHRALDGIVHEVILATNFTNEGEATAHYIGQMLKTRVKTPLETSTDTEPRQQLETQEKRPAWIALKVSRLARGVPVGGELEYIDPGTIAQAVLDRRLA